MSRYEELLDCLIKGETANIEPRSRMEQVLLNCIEKCGCDGLPAPQSNAEAYLQALAEQMKGGGSGGAGDAVAEVGTASALDSILANATDADLGKVYYYTGASTDTYEQGALYMITKEE